MSLKLQQLRHFVLVAEERGFRNAAARANRSQAAVSSSVRELESRLGQALFEHGNKARLTPFGQACLPRVQDMIVQADRLETDLLAMARGHSGRVRLAAVPSVASRLLPPVLVAFSKRLPTVEVELEDDTAERVEARLLQGEVDIAIGSQVQGHELVEFRPMCTDPVGVVCSRRHPLADLQRPLQWRDLIDQDLIFNGTVRLLRDTPLQGLMETARYRVSNMMSMYALLEHNVGVTTLPRLAMDAAHPELLWLPLKAPRVERSIGIQRLCDRTLSPSAQVFHDLCVEMLGPAADLQVRS